MSKKKDRDIVGTAELLERMGMTRPALTKMQKAGLAPNKPGRAGVEHRWSLKDVAAWLEAEGRKGRKGTADRLAKLDPVKNEEREAFAQKLHAQRNDPAGIVSETIAQVAAGKIPPTAAQAVLAGARFVERIHTRRVAEESVEHVMVTPEAAEMARRFDRIQSGRRREAVALFAKVQMDRDREDLPEIESASPASDAREALKLDPFGEPLEGRQAVRERLAGAQLGRWDVGAP